MGPSSTTPRPARLPGPPLPPQPSGRSETSPRAPGGTRCGRHSHSALCSLPGPGRPAPRPGLSLTRTTWTAQPRPAVRGGTGRRAAAGLPPALPASAMAASAPQGGCPWRSRSARGGCLARTAGCCPAPPAFLLRAAPPAPASSPQAARAPRGAAGNAAGGTTIEEAAGAAGSAAERRSRSAARSGKAAAAWPAGWGDLGRTASIAGSRGSRGCWVAFESFKTFSLRCGVTPGAPPAWLEVCGSFLCRRWFPQ